ncbi:FERM domain-containing protein 6-like [Parambassis ranga]|uniref:FERM domain-containing protein 6-like n=1 Tax=Parambassis ranga TaxID=210632 RepID=A0A6P7IUZ5_9TELE|nr:FERM domain-containing protein 6-like [Parambassis ranga]XP_028267912.1 FERM domain-containing protein 6-like [Parambassis ranga]XP_028267913.1 FERM domain-containing protein 6-like [Parambassis ranga]XP_028267924.1 FERM domain-containing protein 6-like [Parambassis ranga]
MVYYTHSAFHSKHVLRHLSDSHRFHINSREAARYIQQLEDMQASQLHKEATSVTQHSSDKDSAAATSHPPCLTAVLKQPGPKRKRMGRMKTLYLVRIHKLLHGVSVDGPALFPSSYWADRLQQNQQLHT